MHAALQYAADLRKTFADGISLVSGVNCIAEHAFTEMLSTKERYNKNSDRRFYQFIQSFAGNNTLKPLEVHQMGLELAQKLFPQYEVLVATHCNTENIHNHIIVNSVSCENGKKLHQNHDTLVEYRKINDEICTAHGLEVLKSYEKAQGVEPMTSREFQAAMRGDSFKFRLMTTIDECMKMACSKEDFVTLMGYEGYEVSWTDKRKYICYTTPEGAKCRDNKLHDKRYMKKEMENELRIREKILAGGLEKTQFAGFGDSAGNRKTGELGGEELAFSHKCCEPSSRADDCNQGAAAQQRGAKQLPQLAGAKHHGALGEAGADGGEVGAAEWSADGEFGVTGWETEREYFLAGGEADDGGWETLGEVKLSSGAANPKLEATSTAFHRDHYNYRGACSGLLGGVAVFACLGSLSESNRISRYQGGIDSKRLKKLQSKKESLGQKISSISEISY